MCISILWCDLVGVWCREVIYIYTKCIVVYRRQRYNDFGMQNITKVKLSNWYDEGLSKQIRNLEIIYARTQYLTTVPSL